MKYDRFQYLGWRTPASSKTSEVLPGLDSFRNILHYLEHSPDKTRYKYLHNHASDFRTPRHTIHPPLSWLGLRPRHGRPNRRHGSQHAETRRPPRRRQQNPLQQSHGEAAESHTAAPRALSRRQLVKTDCPSSSTKQSQEINAECPPHTGK